MRSGHITTDYRQAAPNTLRKTRIILIKFSTCSALLYRQASASCRSAALLPTSCTPLRRATESASISVQSWLSSPAGVSQI